MQAFFVFLGIGVLQFATIQADAQPRAAVDIAVEFIMGNCFYTLDDISRVKSAARVFKWEVLPADVANMLKPVDGSDFESWAAKFEGQNFLVAVNRGTSEGRSVQSCSVVVNQEADNIIPRLLTGLRGRKINEESDAVQVTEIYAVQHPTQNRVLMKVLRARDGRPPVNVSFMSIREKAP
jgi:hypothetical protein